MYSLIDCINVNSIIRRLYDRVVSITNLVSLDLDAANDKVGLIFNRFTIYKYTSEIGQFISFFRINLFYYHSAKVWTGMFYDINITKNNHKDRKLPTTRRN